MLCLMIGLYPLMYFFIDREFGLLSNKSPELLQDVLWNIAFYGHIVPGGLALLTGWIQFSKKFRQRNPGVHRKIGMMYVSSVAVSGICGIYIGFFATGGIVAALGFILLGVVWLYTTAKAYVSARAGYFNRHETWMTYSYAACFAAVTLRIWLPVLSATMGGFSVAYPVVAWLCWVPNLFVAYLLARQP